MLRFTALSAAGLLAAGLLAACSTADVQSTCGRVESILALVAPYVPSAPAEVGVAVVTLGARKCGTPEYAAARERVLTWLASRGVKAPE
jgi:hypothetical protein